MVGSGGPTERATESAGDEQLTARLRAGDAAALDCLITRYWQPLVRYAARLLRDRDAAQDLVQEAFARLWIRRNRLELGSLRAYLYRILHNLAVDDLRKQRVRRLSFRRIAADDSAAVHPAETAAGAPVDRAVTRAIDDLPPRRRQAFVLAYLHRLTYREIAEVMATSPATVKNQVAAALAQLRETLQPLLAELRESE